MAGKHYLHGCAGFFFSLYCFLFVSLENRVARNFMRVLFLVIFPAIRKYIYCRKRFARKNLPRVNLSKVQKIQYWEIVSAHLQPFSFVQKETHKW